MKRKVASVLILISFLCTACAVKEKTQENVLTSSQYDDNPMFQAEINPDLLFYSSCPLPPKGENDLIQQNIKTGLSSFGNANLNLGFYNMIDYLDQVVKDQEYDWDDQGFNKTRLDRMVSNLDSMKDYIQNEDVKEDMTTAQKLLLHAKDNEEIDGILYAHHILSDLYFWGYGYGFDTTQFSTWEMEPSLEELNCFYGITKLWGFDYPEAVKEICETYDTVDFVYEKCDLTTEVQEKDQEINAILNHIDKEEQQFLTDQTIALSGLLYEYILKGSPAGDETFEVNDTEYASMLATLESCISLLEDSGLKKEFKMVVDYVVLAQNTEDRQIERQALLGAFHMTEDIYMIILNHNNPLAVDIWYHGVLKLLEGESIRTNQYFYLTGEKEFSSDIGGFVDFLHAQ